MSMSKQKSTHTVSSAFLSTLTLPWVPKYEQASGFTQFKQLPYGVSVDPIHSGVETGCPVRCDGMHPLHCELF